MNEKEQSLYKIIHNNHWLVIVALVFFVSCQNSDPSTRPSPLTKDSIQINKNIYRTEYSSPSVRKRKIWGELEPYDKIWRTGANDASIIEISTDIEINGQILPKGKYSFFTIPGKSKWTFIFNKEWKQWGGYNYDQKEDQLRIQVTPEWLEQNQEQLRIYFSTEEFILRWEYLKIAVPFKSIAE